MIYKREADLRALRAFDDCFEGSGSFICKNDDEGPMSKHVLVINVWFIGAEKRAEARVMSI